MTQKTIIGLATASLVAIAAPATATTIGHFAPAGAAGGNLNAYVGTGNSNDNMALDSSGGVSVGLKSHNRFAGDWGAATLESGRAVYSVQPGVGPGDATSNPTMWSYLYAVDFANVNAGDYGIRVKLDFNPSADAVADDEWFTYEYMAPAAKTGASESMGFDWYAAFEAAGDGMYDVGGGFMVNFLGTGNYQDIDVNAAGRYDVEIEVFSLVTDAPDTIVASAQMSVVVVPLPPAAWAGLAGLAGAAVMRRRFRG